MASFRFTKLKITAENNRRLHFVTGDPPFLAGVCTS